MSEVFVSYARSCDEQAEQVAEALRSLGYEVWRDDELPAHRPYSDVIEERLKSARAVVVIWSAEAGKSQWVRAEANAAREDGKLVQVSVDGSIPPMPFNQTQCADLYGWDGNLDAPGWHKVATSVAALAGPPMKTPVASSLVRSKRSVCVLPFVNMSGDPEQEYFSDGISEDITTDLSKISALEVIARNAAVTFKDSAVDIPNVARKLGVSHILEGSVRKAGDRVRVTAQLIDGRTGGHVWAERYDRDLTDIFAIQDEISKAIVGALSVKLLPDEMKAIQHRATSSSDAYNLYLMARQYWVTGNHGDRRREERVIRICQRAVDLDSSYAKAWALLALGKASLRYGFAATDEDELLAAERALAIDPSIAEAHCVMARHSSELGLFDAANVEIAIALNLDPESWEVNKEAARLFMAQRKIAEAAIHFEKAVSLIETDFHSWALLVACYQALGNSEGVHHGARMMLSQSEKVLAEDPSNGAALGICAGGLAILGERDRAKERIEHALLIDPDNLNMRYNFACVLAAYLEDTGAALDLLDAAFQMMSPSLIQTASVDPDLDSLREIPRFQKMLAHAQQRVALAETTVEPRQAI